MDADEDHGPHTAIGHGSPAVAILELEQLREQMNGIFAAYRNGVDLHDAAKFSEHDAQLLAARLRDALLSPGLTRADTINVISPSATEVAGECAETIEFTGKNADKDAGVRDNTTGIAGLLRTFGPNIIGIAKTVPIGTAGPLLSSITDGIANTVPFGIAGPPLTSIFDDPGDPGKHHASAPRPPKPRPPKPSPQLRRPRPRGSETALRPRTGIFGHARLRKTRTASLQGRRPPAQHQRINEQRINEQPS
jgi:hypothetical protein